MDDIYSFAILVHLSLGCVVVFTHDISTVWPTYTEWTAQDLFSSNVVIICSTIIFD